MSGPSYLFGRFEIYGARARGCDSSNTSTCVILINESSTVDQAVAPVSRLVPYSIYLFHMLSPIESGALKDEYSNDAKRCSGRR